MTNASKPTVRTDTIKTIITRNTKKTLWSRGALLLLLLLLFISVLLTTTIVALHTIRASSGLWSALPISANLSPKKALKSFSSRALFKPTTIILFRVF